MLSASQAHKSLADFPDFCTLADLATVLAISKATTYRMADQGGIPCIRLGKRIILSKNHLKQWIDQEIGFKIETNDREDVENGQTGKRRWHTVPSKRAKAGYISTK